MGELEGKVAVVTKHAVAVAVRRADGLVLAVRRPDEPGEELPGVWGLPAVTLRDGEPADDGVRRVGREKLGVELTPLRLLAAGEQRRVDYTLSMSVYEASMSGTPALPQRTEAATTTLYEAFDWLPDGAFHAAAEAGSLCCRLFLDAALSPGPSPMNGRGETTEHRERLQVTADRKRLMVEQARTYRKEPTRSEELLWEQLRRKRLDGYKFRRQHPFGPFILDFYCPERRLVVEVDGPIHATQAAADQERQKLLEAAGLKVVRVRTDDVEGDIAAVLSKIREALD